MHGLETVDHLPQRLGESIVRCARVGEHRVATPCRGRIADQNRRCWWGRHEGDVGVPASVAAALGSILFEDLGELGMAWHDRVSRGWFAQRAGQRDLLGVGQVLVAQHQQPMILEQCRQPRGIKSIAHMAAAELEAEHAGDGRQGPGRAAIGHLGQHAIRPVRTVSRRHRTAGISSKS